MRGGRLGGVDVMKCETGFEEGAPAPEEPALVALVSGNDACSADVEGFVKSFDTTLVIDTFGGTKAT